MADHAPFPADSLHRVLAHLENERALHEEASDNRQFDAVYKHVGKLREWLSDVEELGDAVTIERAGISETADVSETPAS
jgi:hypothetical protein